MEKVTSEDVSRVNSHALKPEGSCCDTHDQIEVITESCCATHDHNEVITDSCCVTHDHNEVIIDNSCASETESTSACCGDHNHSSGADTGHGKEHSSRHAIVSMDTLGIFASTLCLIHCLAMPLVVASLPLLGLQFLEGHGAHVVLAGFVVCFGLCAILPGYLKHRKPAVMAGLVTGLTLVLIATFGYIFGVSEAFELPLITVGNLVLVMSHFFNRKLCQCVHH